ncbi:hypothetical protein TanjilG_15637 [Lupinus angustifolius]|uniref:DUF724 domain-containing protein 3-like n=1 Tax=Lupinus angustifolius TaxID=3871 RepID=UPI00090D924A|nr:PREDICTED: DUF724 domain-containing protein 3-like [Lupinus angustifolius]OIV90904.1 hypothetical protein TanjilG_15637 [Lupinus angustifolius]
MASKSKAAKTSSASSPATAPFNAGSAVEISSDDNGFRGSLFTGKIIRRLANDRLLIEYDNLIADESGSKRLREILKLYQLRPIPPTENNREFKFGDEVDAYHNDGWWEGHVTEECGNGKFAVYFRVSRQQIVFHKEELRLHREWFNENWVPPFPQKQEEEKVLLTPNVTSAESVTSDVKSAQTVTPNVKPVEIVIREERFSVGTPVEVSSDEKGYQGAWFSATVVQVIGKRKFLVEYQSLLADDDSQLLREEVNTHHIRPRPPQTVVDDHFSLLEEVDAFHKDGWWVGMVSKVVDNSRYVVYFRNSSEELEFQHSQLRKHQDWIDGKWIMASKVWHYDCTLE